MTHEHKIIIWGLGNTLVSHPPERIKYYFNRQCVLTAWRMAGQDVKNLGKSKQFIEYSDGMGMMIDAHYQETRSRIGAMVSECGLEEREAEFFQQYYSDIIQLMIPRHPSQFRATIEEKVRFAFENSSNLVGGTIEHRLLSNSSTKWSDFWLDQLGINRYFSKIMGLDAVYDPETGKMDLRHKAVNKNAVHAVMDGANPKQVIVFDNDDKFLTLFRDLYPDVTTVLCGEFQNDKRSNRLRAVSNTKEFLDFVMKDMGILSEPLKKKESNPLNGPKQLKLGFY